MGYLRSSIIIQPTGLCKVSIVYAGALWGEYIEHETFETIGECETWLLEKRCYKMERVLELEVKKGEKMKNTIAMEKSIADRQMRTFKDVLLH